MITYIEKLTQFSPMHFYTVFVPLQTYTAIMQNTTSNFNFKRK